MAEKKIVKADGEKVVKEAKPTGNAGGLRAGAIVFWILAIACEALAYIQLSGIVILFAKLPAWTGWIFLGLDLVFVIIGSLMWKKANRIKPASKKNKVKFWLWNNMGLIVSIFAFLPFIILILTNKDMNTTAEGKKTKRIAVIVGVIALAIACLCGIEYDPVSQENQAAAEAITDNVYWTQYGKVYHLYQDCSSLTNSTELIEGTADQAIAANRKRICKICYKRAGLDNEDLLVEADE